MTSRTLYIGNKNYSSWSLRPWLAMRVAEIDFTEKLIPLFDEAWPQAIAKVSPTNKVPVLHDGGLVLPETIAILEYAAELKPELWPADTKTRAMARAVAAEMHAGFTALRSYMPMNIRKNLSGLGMGPGVDVDIERICKIWHDCRSQFSSDGSFLFGGFSNADAMFAPIVSRFMTYQPVLPTHAKTYMEAVQSLPAMQAWNDAARQEVWTVTEDEVE